jgi:hypothetical protein
MGGKITPRVSPPAIACTCSSPLTTMAPYAIPHLGDTAQRTLRVWWHDEFDSVWPGQRIAVGGC